LELVLYVIEPLYIKRYFAFMKKKAKTRSNYIKELDNIFSQYIRLRDSDSMWIVVCPLCKKRIFRKQAQNMHFISRGVLKYRYDEKNCHAWCMRCNVILNWNYIVYTIRMINTYWKRIVNEMINDKTVFNITTPRLQELIEYYIEKRNYLLRTKRFTCEI